MKRIAILFGLILLIGCSEDSIINKQDTSNYIVFALCEGAFGSNDGSLWGIKDNTIEEIAGNPTGNTATSLATHGNNLYVVNNASSNVLKYTISEEGIVEQTSEILDLNGSQPREIYIIDNTAYVSQWNINGIAVIDLDSFTQTSTIDVGGSTEGLTFDGTYLYATVKYLNTDSWPYPAGNTVEKINLISNQVEESITISNNPDLIIYHNDYLYISSQTGDWPNYEYLTEKIDPLTNQLISSVNHGGDYNLGVDFAIHNGTLYRSYDKGIISFNDNLTLDESSYIGTSNSNSLYSMDINNGMIYLGFSDYTAPDDIIVLDFNGNELGNYQVGASPGSFAFWTSE